jgi:hypothetical protein
MARPRPARPVKLIVGMLGGDVDLLRRARQLLKHDFGEIDLESDLWPFDQTDYYEEEMGPGLQRWFLSFARVIRPESLPEIKRHTNELEERIAGQAMLPERPRPVNLDPGYVDLNKLVLATTKDRDHRIYLNQGIYAEVTLRYRDGAWQPWPWTYPDYQQPHYLEFFERVRQIYRAQLRQLGPWAAAAEEAGP